MVTLGIISDTHIPDRSKGLHPKVLDVFRSARVEAILHAGDISTPAVLQELGEVAPVYAVRGNRDIYALPHLPVHITLPFAGFQVGLIHGHGRLPDYLSDKAHILFFGVQVQRYRNRVVQALSAVDVLVFGHLHLRVYERIGGKLLLNPGSACCPDWKHGFSPGIALLHLQAGGGIEAEFFDLQKKH
jgi:putative phosphoesterase